MKTHSKQNYSLPTTHKIYNRLGYVVFQLKEVLPTPLLVKLQLNSQAVEISLLKYVVHLAMYELYYHSI
jgi:hypothetical protein